MTEENKEVVAFVQALANDDYIAADKVFPKVVQNALKTIINNRKPEVMKVYSAEAEKLATASLVGEPKKE